MFPDDYFVLQQEIVGFIQEFELYNYMTDWTKDKDPEEVREIYDKRTEELKDDVYYWERRNFEHKTTLEQTPVPVKEERIKKHTESYNSNRKNHKNYKPIKVRIDEPAKTPIVLVFESERDFFEKTHFEATTLVNLKKNKTHKVKRILPSTKHNYSKGTIITLLDQLDEHLSEGEANT